MLRGAVEVKESAAAQSVKRFKYHVEMAEIISRVGYTYTGTMSTEISKTLTPRLAK